MTPTDPGPRHRLCDCGRAIRGLVPDQPALIDPSPRYIDGYGTYPPPWEHPASPTVPAHFCLQCSPEHCKMRAFIVDQFANTDHPLDRAPE